MSTRSNQPSPIAEQLHDMLVAQTLLCSRCGYDLRGLIANSDCPECGEPIRLTIIETIDPASRRLPAIKNPTVVGNAVTGVVSFFFISLCLSVLAAVGNAPQMLPVPQFVTSISTTGLVSGSLVFGVAALLCLIPVLQMCTKNELVGCKGGLSLTSLGLLLWSAQLGILVMYLVSIDVQNVALQMLFDSCLPVVTAGVVFSGFKKLIPRLGLRSRAFRQAQGSRQRMNDLLVALVFVLLGRLLLLVAGGDSNTELIGLIIMVMSISLVVVGLLYFLRNTIWIRRALISPPPALQDLLRSVG